MSADRWTDDDGHAWPVTGAWCDACGLPLTPTPGAPTAHPGCQDGAPEQDHMREVPVSSSSRHSVSRAVPTRPDADYCPDCGDPLDGPALMRRCTDRHGERESA